MQVASWLEKCLCTPEERRKVWRKLHETFSGLGESRRATEALVYLLSTYNDDDAAEARQDFFKIFLSGNLTTFKAFMKKHPDFLKQNGLDEDACRHKLRLLTLMQISENQADISYDAAVKELELPVENLESFIIEAVSFWDTHNTCHNRRSLWRSTTCSSGRP
ncbi:unnamed protein product [Echinostoma caproni]|uniref:PCI domain-containing protein n=1 Tax=Echinostoma caproni TaxID=27848 RepID=A0A183BBG0_9TREM|nr:unnamed protein product [Echinostoma caproni]